MTTKISGGEPISCDRLKTYTWANLNRASGHALVFALRRNYTHQRGLLHSWPRNDTNSTELATTFRKLLLPRGGSPRCRLSEAREGQTRHNPTQAQMWYKKSRLSVSKGMAYSVLRAPPVTLPRTGEVSSWADRKHGLNPHLE